MAEREETTTSNIFEDSSEPNFKSESEKAAYRHNIKERLRHQKIQSILEHVGKHVPKPTTAKKETKAKCLRRVVLYMKFLLQKSEEMKLLPDCATDTVSSASTASKRGRKRKNESLYKKHFVPKINCRKAQIIFLKKFTSSSFEKISPNEPELNKYPEHDTNSHNAVEANTEVNGFENFETPKTQCSSSKNFYSSSIETAAAVSSITDQENYLPLEKSYPHTSTPKICSNNLNLNNVPREIAESLSKNSLQEQYAFNSKKTTRGKSMEVELSSFLDPTKQKRKHTIRMPVFSKKTDDTPSCNSKVLLPDMSKVFAVPSVSSYALGTASMPSFCSLTAADSISTFSNGSADVSPVPMDKHSQNFSSSNDLYSSLLSQFYPDDQDGMPSDFLSSSDTTTIPSSNEFISDDTDNVSLTKQNSLESPEVYPDIFGSMSSQENDTHRACETLTDIESFILNENMSKPPAVNASSYVPSSKRSANVYQNLNVLNSEKPVVMSGFDMNMSETPSLLNCSFIPQPIGIIPNDLFSFQSNLSEFFYMYPNIENTPVMLSGDNGGSQNDEFSPGMNLDFCETFSEPTMYSEAQPSSSSTFDMFKNIKIKEEILDMLPDDEVSGSLNHLGSFSW